MDIPTITSVVAAVGKETGRDDMGVASKRNRALAVHCTTVERGLGQ